MDSSDLGSGGMDRLEFDTDPIFRSIASLWNKQIVAARDHKREAFGAQALESMMFYTGPKTWGDLMNPSGQDIKNPRFNVSINKAFEFVSIFAPALNFDTPVRTIKPRMPLEIPPDLLGINVADPMQAQQWMQMNQAEQQKVRDDGLVASLLGMYLNWSPKEFGLENESRSAVEEALIKGRSCAWTELYTPKNSETKVVRTMYDSVDNLFVDPDCKDFREALWVARRCVHPTWEVERKYGLRAGTLKANSESVAATSGIQDDPDAHDRRRRGETNDLIEYYQIYSRMGIGGRLPDSVKSHRAALEVFGDYCYVVVAVDHTFLLNLPPDLMKRDAEGDMSAGGEIISRVSWPTPYWQIDDFPVSTLDFVNVPNSSWPMSPLTPAKGELRFLNWAHSFLLGHIQTTARTLIGLKKGASDDAKNAILNGEDLEVIDIEFGGKIDEIVAFLNHPQMNGDLWKVIEAVEKLFDKRVGLSELLYGTTGVQLRSAEEVQTKQQNSSVRPEDMANRVEAWHTLISKKEAIAARFHLTGEDVRDVCGALGAWVWQQFVFTRDAQQSSRQLQYTIEAGSTRRPNKSAEIRQMTEAFTNLSPVFMSYMQQTGDPTAMNNLLSDFAKSRDLDPARYQLAAAPPPPPQQMAGGPEAVQQQPTSNPPIA